MFGLSAHALVNLVDSLSDILRIIADNTGYFLYFPGRLFQLPRCARNLMYQTLGIYDHIVGRSRQSSEFVPSLCGHLHGQITFGYLAEFPGYSLHVILDTEHNQKSHHNHNNAGKNHQAYSH